MSGPCQFSKPMVYQLIMGRYGIHRMDELNPLDECLTDLLLSGSRLSTAKYIACQVICHGERYIAVSSQPRVWRDVVTTLDHSPDDKESLRANVLAASTSVGDAGAFFIQAVDNDPTRSQRSWLAGDPNRPKLSDHYDYLRNALALRTDLYRVGNTLFHLVDETVIEFPEEYRQVPGY